MPHSIPFPIAAIQLSHWGEEGLHAHLQRVQSLYAERAAATIDALEREAKGLLEWKEPTAGMFLVRCDEMSTVGSLLAVFVHGLLMCVDNLTCPEKLHLSGSRLLRSRAAGLLGHLHSEGGCFVFVACSG